MQALQSSKAGAATRSGRAATRPSRGVLRVSAVAAAPKAASAKEAMTPELAKVLYEDMVLGRDFEDMCAQMYYRGKMFGFVHLYCGQEAVSTGVIKAMRETDYVCSTYRDHVHALSKGVPAREIMSELFGKQTGCCRGQGGSMHMFSAKHNVLGGYAFIGEGIPIGLGAAFQSKVRVPGQVDAWRGEQGTNSSASRCLRGGGGSKVPAPGQVEAGKGVGAALSQQGRRMELTHA
eukprot:282493-Chlamydomonas_euryale.AAC.5